MLESSLIDKMQDCRVDGEQCERTRNYQVVEKETIKKPGKKYLSLFLKDVM
jgi:hypothetical protein